MKGMSAFWKSLHELRKMNGVYIILLRRLCVLSSWQCSWSMQLSQWAARTWHTVFVPYIFSLSDRSSLFRNLLESICNKKSQVNFSALKVKPLFNGLLPSEWSLHLQMRPLYKKVLGKLEIQTLLRKDLHELRNIFEKLSFVWTFQCRVFRDRKFLREHLQ